MCWQCKCKCELTVTIKCTNFVILVAKEIILYRNTRYIYYNQWQLNGIECYEQSLFNPWVYSIDPKVRGWNSRSRTRLNASVNKRFVYFRTGFKERRRGPVVIINNELSWCRCWVCISLVTASVLCVVWERLPRWPDTWGPDAGVHQTLRRRRLSHSSTSLLFSSLLADPTTHVQAHPHPQSTLDHLWPRPRYAPTRRCHCPSTAVVLLRTRPLPFRLWTHVHQHRLRFAPGRQFSPNFKDNYPYDSPSETNIIASLDPLMLSFNTVLFTLDI